MKQEDSQHDKSPESASNAKQNGTSVELKCPVCEQVLLKISEMIYHIQEHCESVGSGRTDSTLHRGPMCCPVCKNQLSNVMELRDHLKTEHTDTKLNCSICKKSFSHPKTLKLHMRLHNSSKGYECSICHKRFTRKENRKAHMKTHKGFKTALYQCLTETNKKTMDGLNCGSKREESASETELSTVNGAE